MSKTQNSVQLIGYLGRDPLVTTAKNGSKRAFLRIATNYYRKNKDGTALKKTTWHDIVAWDKKAENIENEFITGSHVLVEGEIDYQTFVKGTQKRYVTRILATKILNLDR
ncbi:single-stranded DNA-binding protein [Sediminibacterium roseum]|uniref:Single-stranded DNA-binding protein n=1 Tax=Sediminibacterium roseum TaxID=1978412 RepID=A0ABW9ZWJ0_9BACT|nr:single-stranded DNA-binding protein [Sediminibacterium roseum]NCI51384.1 single-stranded DNA-binding protein [Sediminibacterium roseum]